MKKQLFVFAATALLISCASDGLRNEIVETETPIGFETFSSKALKSSSSPNLEDYLTTFGVWSYKTVKRDDPQNPGTQKDTEEEVMNGDHGYKVTHNDANGHGAASWHYDGTAGLALGQVMKYWDKSASKYEFYAYAPYSENVTISNHVISIAAGQYAANENLQGTLSTTLNSRTFTGDGTSAQNKSTDWMMPAAYTRNATNNVMGTGTVVLDFKHILSKIIVVVKTQDDFPYDITLNSISLNNIFGTGSFNGTNWDITGQTAVNLDGAAAGTISKSTTTTQNMYYSIECLAIPQSSAQPKLSVNYTISGETFDVVDAAIDQIQSFAKGTVYTITATIGPAPIHFDCTVTDWTVDNNGSSSIQ